MIKNKDFPALYQDLKGSGIYSLKRDGDDYVFYLDAEERTYRFTVKAKGNSQDWERFMNKNPVY